VSEVRKVLGRVSDGRKAAVFTHDAFCRRPAAESGIVGVTPGWPWQEGIRAEAATPPTVRLEFLAPDGQHPSAWAGERTVSSDRFHAIVIGSGLGGLSGGPAPKSGQSGE
jgi:hypothetical protein